ncbi:MAG: Sir2 family NAD-dependent protein deacetylase [Lachnospiraceae bacterium]
MKECIENADAVVIGAGAGLSTSAGLSYGEERFKRLLLNYMNQYGLTDMYSAAFYPYKTPEEFWGYMSCHIYHNRYEQEINDTYKNLLHLVKDKNYFVITTNVDHLFQKNGFDKERLFYTQGDYGLFQCSVPCHDQTYDNKELIYEMVEKQKDFKIPTELIPLCPKCGKPMTTNLRKDNSFVQDDGWHKAMDRYSKFITENKNKKIVFLELGVGFNTPSIIKYPFWQMTYNNKNATFISMNANESVCAKEIMKQSILIEDDICEFLDQL